MLNRRDMIKGICAVAGASTAVPYCTASAADNKVSQLHGAKQPKRVVFFLQSQGFSDDNCTVKGIKSGKSLKSKDLPVFIDPLSPHRDKLTIIQGLHGKHTSPAHSAYYGCLGGYRRNKSTPFDITIDCALSKVLPEAPVPLLSVGMESLNRMKQVPIFHATSAWGPGDKASMICDPTFLYRIMFGSVATGKQRSTYDENSKMLDFIAKTSTQSARTLPESARQKLKPYRDISAFRDSVSTVSESLKAYMPEFDEKYSAPQHETDWHDAMLDLTIAALKAGLTNVATINSGCGEFYGSWEGLGINPSGHSLGHLSMTSDIWTRIRQYNMRMLSKLVQALEETPEGNGTMMDNTLIVYTSNNADKQHTNGASWPFMTLGNFGGTMQEGHYVKVENDRPINSFYATLLEAAGNPVEHFNMGGAYEKYDTGKGSLRELLT
ncbi:DUF1552 domain-containing protein [Mariniblastus sp.]|jgi:hypothetical protein|nr:DUF1552 domain-containing protein [Mariniblastus sp.]MDA7923065.1 DUF1552 domain-containing protein [bacterium]MDA7924741.1 DUF1552 domain-containing protein [Mariniblastus sp.]MDB4380508.1 DUF1552 domain-containing protein [Mariniblastus sp.]MDC3224382.1 DUF1552 domain-containing protein [Mariniblastus sp.]